MNRKTKFQMQNRKHSTRHLRLFLLSHIHALVVANLLFLSGDDCMQFFCKKAGVCKNERGKGRWSFANVHVYIMVYKKSFINVSNLEIL